MKETESTIGKRLASFRKTKKLTQAEVAKQLNYSDKAVSKWERDESVPDVAVLKKLSEIYDVPIEVLVNGKEKQTTAKKRKLINVFLQRHILITTMSVLLVWLVATICFVAIKMSIPALESVWLAFIYAVPVSFLVAFIFSCIWGKNIIRCILLSCFIWTLATAFFLTFSIPNVWMIYLLPIPFQALILLWFFFRGKIIKLYKAIIHQKQIEE